MELWTREHALLLIPAFVIELILSILIAKWLKNRSDKIKLIPILTIGIILFVLEILKQIFWGFRTSQYDLYCLPFHFCSLFIFIYILTYFIRGKYQENMRIFSTVCGGVLFLMMLVYPALIFTNYDILHFSQIFISFHTVIFHLLSVFAFMLIICMNLYTLNIKRDLLTLTTGIGIFSIVSAIMANILKTNFASFYFSQMTIFEGVRLSIIASLGVFGQIVYDIIVFLSILMASIGSYFLIFGIRKLVDKRYINK